MCFSSDNHMKNETQNACKLSKYDLLRCFGTNISKKSSGKMNKNQRILSNVRLFKEKMGKCNLLEFKGDESATKGGEFLHYIREKTC